MAVQCSRDGIWDIDLEGVSPPYCSPRFLSMTGIAPEKLLHQADWLNLLHPCDTEARQFLKNAFASIEDIPPAFSFDHRILCSDGEYRWFMSQGMLLFNSLTQQPIRLIGVTSDIQERKAREEESTYRATHDPLTGLPNRALFEESLKHSINTVKRNGHCLALVLLDLDNFKSINDTMGHLAGDAVLVSVSKQLKRSIRESDMACRFGGDEFFVLLTFKSSDDPNIEVVALRMLDALRSTVWHEDKPIKVTASMGVALCPDDGDEPALLLRRADEAMYFAKERGRNLCAIWRPDGLHRLATGGSQ